MIFIVKKYGIQTRIYSIIFSRTSPYCFVSFYIIIRASAGTFCFASEYRRIHFMRMSCIAFTKLLYSNKILTAYYRRQTVTYIIAVTFPFVYHPLFAHELRVRFLPADISDILFLFEYFQYGHIVPKYSCR